MTISVFDLFSIGIGPSSSHTVGPMKAANAFIKRLAAHTDIAQIKTIQVELFGSLAFTGKGHGTDNAILLGLEDELPQTVDPDRIKIRAERIKQDHLLNVNRQKTIRFNYDQDMIFNYKDLLPLHTNGMRFTAYDAKHTVRLSAIYYSIGGGFILDEEQAAHPLPSATEDLPYAFNTAKDLLAQCEANQFTIKDLMLANECSMRDLATVQSGLLAIADTMRLCIDKGCTAQGILPGGLAIKRRAPLLFEKLQTLGKPVSYHHTDSIAWLNLFAIAVNEENAAGGRIVTAPTNGASGIIPAVLHYYLNFYPNAVPDDAIDFLLTAGAIAILYKKGASISGAEVGCQGEVGVACSMAAAALTALLGGSLYQVENAAEIAMEHHLGMTCDPINGLVQIPCIERNAMGAVKAVNAARLALLGDGKHYVSLDKVIATMKQTGKDMMTIYKETSRGGLAANLPEC